MALDGIFLHALTAELSSELKDARLYKIQQTEEWELLLTFKVGNESKKVLLSVNPALPLVYLTNMTKESPLVAPNFLMVLRKHLMNARLNRIDQPGLERAITFHFDHLDEMGDLRVKHLYVELMGRYSNLILTDENQVIIDAIKRVPPTLSSVRTVLPGHTYFLPEANSKTEILTLTDAEIRQEMNQAEDPYRYPAERFIGFSKSSLKEFFYEKEKDALCDTLLSYVRKIRDNRFDCRIAYRGRFAKEFGAFPLYSYETDEYRIEKFSSPSALLEDFYRERNQQLLMKSRTAETRKTVSILKERSEKTALLQEKQLADTESKDLYRLYGDLLNAYAYCLAGGESHVTVENYEDENKPITIPLDATKSIRENAIRYYEKYNKLKRTREALVSQMEENTRKTSYLSSILHALNLVETEDDLTLIRDELVAHGFLRKKSKEKVRKSPRQVPYHFLSSDGFHIYVGKNNVQNEELTFKLATGQDYFFHAKKITGSHVIVKTEGKELSDRTLTEAASLAAYYSDGRESDKVEVDYVLKKEVKKVAGGPTGLVIYHTNKSVMAVPGTGNLKRLNK